MATFERLLLIRLHEIASLLNCLLHNTCVPDGAEKYPEGATGELELPDPLPQATAPPMLRFTSHQSGTRWEADPLEIAFIAEGSGSYAGHTWVRMAGDPIGEERCVLPDFATVSAAIAKARGEAV